MRWQSNSIGLNGVISSPLRACKCLFVLQSLQFANTPKRLTPPLSAFGWVKCSGAAVWRALLCVRQQRRRSGRTGAICSMPRATPRSQRKRLAHPKLRLGPIRGDNLISILIASELEPPNHQEESKRYRILHSEKSS